MSGTCTIASGCQEGELLRRIAELKAEYDAAMKAGAELTANLNIE